MIYLRFFSVKTKIRILYLFVRIDLFSFAEFVFQKNGQFIDSNEGAYSILESGLHYKRPMLSILLSIPSVIIMLFFHHPSFLDLNRQLYYWKKFITAEYLF